MSYLIAMRMMVVLAFLIGMPLVAVPQVWEQLHRLFGQESHRRITATASAADSEQEAEARTLTAHQASASSLAADRSQVPPVAADAEALAATIETLKARFVTAGVTYMVLEQIAADVPTYRFQFDMPVAVGSAYTKRFQVVDAAPDEAMRQALMELDQWQVAGRERDHLERPTVILR